ncbi:hypothetical protein [Noviherbaspirillum sp. ST9]|uniref:hypothetical protein n=1 Tax=Noviherbaspirillum sp. ST9 TaxID=3401606 RepID=UPI003B587463
MKITLTMLAAAASLLAGCATPYELQLETGQGSALLNIKGDWQRWICRDGARKVLQPDEKGYAAIPAGERITVGTSFYGGNASCSARSSFIPMAGERYFLDFDIESEKCFSLPYREVSYNRVGLALVHTAAPSGECGAR